MVRIEQLMETAIEQQGIERNVNVRIPDTFTDVLRCASEGMSEGVWHGIDGIATYCIRCETENLIMENS